MVFGKEQELKFEYNNSDFVSVKLGGRIRKVRGKGTILRENNDGRGERER